MEKSPDAFRTISEVAAMLETPAHVLRFWESKFPQIKPVKRAGGRRYYRPADIALLAGIKVLLHEQGMMIRGVQKLLREQGPRHVAGLSPLQWAVAAVDEAEIADALAEKERPGTIVHRLGPAGDAEPEAEDATPTPDPPDEADDEAALADDPASPMPEPLEAPEAPAATPGVLDSILARTLERLDAPPDKAPPPQGDGGTDGQNKVDGEVSASRLLASLSRADPDRLRAGAARIAPLVRRLEALRGASAARDG